MHEPLADLHGVAAGGAGAGLVVDADTDQRRACGLFRLLDQPLEIVLVAAQVLLARPLASATATMSVWLAAGVGWLPVIW